MGNENIQIRHNEQGFLSFQSRAFDFAGDRQTWVKRDFGELIIRKARKGTISDKYSEELQNFLSQFGVDFSEMGYGETKTVEIDLTKVDTIMYGR